MIAGWVVKLLLGLALIGFLAVELGSPLLVRVQLSDVAHEAADSAAFELREHGRAAQAEAAAKGVAAQNHAEVREFGVDARGVVHVTVFRQARSYLLKRFGPTEDWYRVSSSASAGPKS